MEQQPDSQLPVKLEPLLKQIQEFIPKATNGRNRAVEAIQKVTSIETDADLQELNQLVVAVRNTQTAIINLRKPITEQTDDLKQLLMQYEKDLQAEMDRARKVIGDYNQKKIDAKREAEERAAKMKAKENHKVDIRARIKSSLSNMVIERIRQVQDGSKDFFDPKNTTLEAFDERARTYKGMKPRLKQEHYDSCFTTTFDKNLLSQEEFDALINEVKQEEPFDKWNEDVKKEIIPIFNDWIGRIDQIKQDLLDMKNAKDDEERKRIEAEQQKKKAEEEKQREDELRKKEEQRQLEIQQQSDVDKLQNDFREQAATQTMEDTGPVKLIARFKDDKPVKALCEIIYQVFASPKAPAIVKKNKDGSTKLDEHGFPVYVDGVKFWLDFFLKYCDVNISNLEIKEISKVIVRK